MATRWIVTALGKDRPGIVAGVTKALYQLGCNLEDSAMTRLEGEFAIMLIFSSPSRVTPEVLRKAFEPLERRAKLVVHLKRLTQSETRPSRRSGRTYIISVYGGDRPGIVFRVSEALKRSGINITDVHTHRSTGPGPSLYLMLLEVGLPPRCRVASIERKLKQIARRLGVEISLRPSEADVL
ncbi:MAG: ACT domain-containing protein [Candidatus Omnitrophica bacterium]|nr:ACT domain-containing protein [Candidatus Omnitrophota bacterium]